MFLITHENNIHYMKRKVCTIWIFRIEGILLFKVWLHSDKTYMGGFGWLVRWLVVGWLVLAMEIDKEHEEKNLPTPYSHQRKRENLLN